MPAGKRVLLIASALGVTVGCGSDAPSSVYGACETFTAADGTMSCREARALTEGDLQGFRAAYCQPTYPLPPVGSRCSRDNVVGGCLGVYGRVDDPSAMIPAINWYYVGGSIQTDADVMNICISGDWGVLLTPGKSFVPADGDLPPPS